MKIQHKRSNQLDGSSAKEPTSDFMEYGELAVNFNENDPAIFLKDSGDNVIRIAGAGANGNIEIPDAGSDPHQEGTSDDRYVEITGDNMTGNLTLGTDDKITLDATDGTADFAGALTGTSADFSVSVTATQGFVGSSYSGFDAAINKATNVFDSRDNTLKIYYLTTTTDGSVYIGNKAGTGANSDDNSDNAQIVLDGADGSATFAKDVSSGGGGSEYGFRGFNGFSAGDDDDYAAIVGSCYDASGRVFLGVDAQNNIQTSEILANGSATFVSGLIELTATGTVDATSSSYSFIGRAANGTANFAVDSNTNVVNVGPISGNDSNIILKGTTGSATFASTITSGPTTIQEGPPKIINYVTFGGNFDVGSATGNAFAVYRSDNLLYASIKNDGSADFAGDIYSGSERSNDVRYARLAGSQGAIVVNNPDDLTSFKILKKGVDSITMSSNGTATFTGAVTAPNVTFNLEPDNDANYTTTTEEYTETESYTGPLGNTLEREVTRTRDVLTYTGPTLDVKDRLQNVLSRIDAIEANEVADDATDSALLQLVASLTARLDEKDAAIASLTATLTALTDRVTTLES